MQTMRAIAVTGVGQVRVVDDVPVPEPGDYEALAKVHACGFCNGTDFHIIEGRIDPGVVGPYPTLLGHESAGEIVRTGKKVRNIRIGDRYVNPMLHAEPGNGYSRTWSGMSEYGLVLDKAAMREDGVEYDHAFDKQGPFPDAFDYVDAGVLLSLAESHSAAKNFGCGPGHDVLIYGAGPMGTALAMFVKMNGARSVTHVDSMPDRLEHSRKTAKVDRTIDFRAENLDAALGDQLFDMVIDAVGKSAILIGNSKRLKFGGKVCSMGVLGHDDRMIDASLLKDNTSLHMLNYPVGEYAIMPQTIDLATRGKIDFKDFYSHTLPFTEIHQVMELIRTKKAFKVVMTF